MLRLCDPYLVDVPEILRDRTGYAFEEAGGAEPDRVTVEAEELPETVTPEEVLQAARRSAAAALDGDAGWREGQVETGCGPASTLAIVDPEIAGGAWLATLRGPDGRIWTLRFESARAGAEAVFSAIVASVGLGPAPPGWVWREAFATPLALPPWLRPPRVYRFVSDDGEARLAIDQGSSDMPGESEFETWGEPAPGELLTVETLADERTALSGAEAVRGSWRLDRCDVYGGVLGSTWARVVAAPGLQLRLVLIERGSEAVGERGFVAMTASVRPR